MAGLLRTKGANVPRDGEEDVLLDVGGVGTAEFRLPAPAQN
jgi:hypothetical protein